VIHSDAVERAVRAVPRHLFTADASLEHAYAADEAVVLKQDTAGVAQSSVSAPALVAMMLEQAVVRPGDRVLEIGSGGYNAALLAELVGPSGAVTTVDIDPEVTGRAARCLTAAGYGHAGDLRGRRVRGTGCRTLRRDHGDRRGRGTSRRLGGHS
jgi:protein-L-isoaspartate(D-aspartate) O-methyltransferase